MPRQYICFLKYLKYLMNYKIILFNAIAVVFSLQLFAQEENDSKKGFLKNILNPDSTKIETNLLVNAEVLLTNDQALQGAKVVLMESGKPNKVAVTDSLGKFQHILEFGSFYQLKFAKPGYVSKILAVDTRDMPQEDKETGYDLGRFKMYLSPYVSGMDTISYLEPVAKYAYDPLAKMFLVEKKYTKKRQKALVKVEEVNARVLEEKKDELEAKNNEYNLLIRDADIEFKNKDYETAKNYYQEALKLKPMEVYPKEHLQKITRLTANEEENRKRYDLLILQGDNAFKAKNKKRALEAYTSALELYPDEVYPQDQIDLLGDMKEPEQEPVEKPKKDPKDFKLSEEDKQKSTGFMSELAKKYPQGLTEEVIDEGSKKTIRRIIVNGNLGVEYKKVKHNWGGEFYFKNGSPTTEYIWLKETE